MTKLVKIGDVILLHYTVRLKEGDVIETSRNRNPLPVRVGSGDLIEGLDEALIGMQPGETKTVNIEPKKGYGNYNENLFKEIPYDNLPDDLIPRKGIQLFLIDKKRKALPVIIKEITEKSIKVDANHPLAGKSLVFELQLVEIS